MIVNRILYHLHSFFMRGINQFLVGFVATKPAVYFVMIGKSVTMFGSVVHIIFNNRVKPQCSNTKRLQVIQMILYSF